jgi:D-alanyl-D-alanine carboxypeptidase
MTKLQTGMKALNQKRKTAFKFCLGLVLALASTGFAATDSVYTAPASSFIVQPIPGLVTNEREIRAGLLYDVNRNVVVWEKDMHYAYPIASLTKMMVGLLAIEDIEAGKRSFNDTIKVTRTFRQRIRRGKYRTYTSHEQYSLEGLLKMAMVASHNESTVWIARHCSNSLEEFVQRMNARAVELGMVKTLFSNPSGLPASISVLDNSSSPRDLLVLALEIMKHPKLMDITGIPYANVSNGRSVTTHRNHNGLVINYEDDVDGIKTGYTKNAKFCLVATSSRAGHRMISIVLGVRSPWVRNGIVASMLNTYYQAVRLGRLGENTPDQDYACAFIDSLNRGLTSLVLEPDLKESDSSDEEYAYTYKTVTQQIRKTHSVRSGDNLGKIANRYGVTVAQIRKWNKLKSSTIRSGQKLAVYTTVRKRIPVKLVVDPDESYADNQPVGGEADTIPANEETLKEMVSQEEEKIESRTPVKSPATPVAGKTPAKGFIYHTVQPGDTLWNIAQKYQANLNQIKKVNRISNGRLLKSGTKIKIPVNGG